MASSTAVHFKEGTFLNSEADSSYNYPASADGSLMKWGGGEFSGQNDAAGKSVQLALTDDSGIVQGDEEEEEEEDIGSEAADVVYPLPENWPCIPQIFQRQSWNFSTAVSPSVNKATSHLELLQTIIEDWFQEAISRSSSRATQARGVSRASRATTSSKRRQMRFAGTPAGGSRAVAGVPKSTLTLSSGTERTTSQLSVYGVGAQADLEARQQRALSASSSSDADIPYLGAEEVLTEVITLLAKLEKDRQDTLDTLHNERDRVRMLGSKIDNLAMNRLTDLPSAIQKEHEACAMDLAELNWHVSYKGRAESRIKQRVEVAETLNTKLKDDIEYVKKHVPLVGEKLELEKAAMDKIKHAQLDTNEELDVIVTRCSKVQGKSDEAHTKANAERTLIAKDLSNVNSDLSNITQELSDARTTHNTYVHNCTDYRQKLHDNDQELKILEVKNENCKVSEAMQASKVADLQAKIVQEEFEHRRLDDEVFRLQSELASSRSSCKHLEEDMQLATKHKEEQLRQLNLRNQELEMDTEDMERKIKDCSKQKTADEKNLERMGRELERTVKQAEVTQDELTQVCIINNAIRDQLRSEEEKCIQAEEALKATTEALKRQVKEEIHSRTVLMARVNSDNTDQNKYKDEMDIKKAKLKKTADEVDAAVRSVQQKVDKLRAAHEQRIKDIEALTSERSQISRFREDTSLWKDEQRAELTPPHQTLQNNLSAVNKQLDHMQWKTEMMYKKMEDMEASNKMMTRAVNNTQAAIDAFQEELDELNLQIKSQQKLQDDTRSSLDEVTSRMRHLEKTHKEHMKERHGVLDQHQKDLTFNLKLNKELASHYRQLQNQYVSLKNEVLDKYDDRVKLENSIKDLKQLQSLQKRMHAALQEYYKLRGLYNQTELANMDLESQQNAVKVGELQYEMDSALDTIAGFLHNQLDGDTIRKMAMEKVEQEERKEAAAAGAAEQPKEQLRVRRLSKQKAAELVKKPPLKPSSRVVSRQGTAVEKMTLSPAATAMVAH